MKAEQIIDVLGKVDEEYIIEAAPALQPVSRRRKNWSAILIAAAATMVMMSTVAFAVSEDLRSAAMTFFARFFAEEVQQQPASYPALDVETLGALSGETIGIVVDTDELQIEVMDVISSGNDAMVALRITAKQLTTVLRNNGFDEVPLNNFRFGIETDGSLFDKLDSAKDYYIYSDADASLAPNQFYLIWTITSLEGFDKGPYTMKLADFGYYNALAPDYRGKITVQYDGPWTFELTLGGDNKESRVAFVNREVEIAGQRYLIERLYLTPLTCTAVITGEQVIDPSLHSEVMASKFELHSINGNQIVSEDQAFGGGKDSGQQKAIYHMQAWFNAPINVWEISSINILGEQIRMIY